MDTSQNNESPNPQNNGNTNPKTDDKPSIGLSILSFFIPLVGFILAAVDWKSKPISAKRYLIVWGIAFAFCIFVNVGCSSRGSGSTDSGSTNSGSTDSGSTNSGSTDSGSTNSEDLKLCLAGMGGKYCEKPCIEDKNPKACKNYEFFKREEREKREEQLRPCECHASEWQLTEVGTLRYTVSNVCWQNTPISLPPDCYLMAGYLEKFQNGIELNDDFEIRMYRDELSSGVLSCAKAINNEKLRQVAKECNGKWY